MLDSLLPDATSPPGTLGAVPSGVSPNATGLRIQLSWSESVDPESGVWSYRVYRDGQLVGTSVVTSYVDSGLSEGSSHSYEVSAVNGVGLESNRSAPVTGTTLADSTAPTIESVNIDTATPLSCRYLPAGLSVLIEPAGLM